MLKIEGTDIKKEKTELLKEIVILRNENKKLNTFVCQIQKIVDESYEFCDKNKILGNLEKLSE